MRYFLSELQTDTEPEKCIALFKEKNNQNPSMDVRVKQEIVEALVSPKPNRVSRAVLKCPVPPDSVIELSSSSSSSSESDSDSDESENGNNGNDEAGGSFSSGIGGSKKKRKLQEIGVIVPAGFLAPLPSSAMEVANPESTGNGTVSLTSQSFKQFWKAGDYERAPSGDWELSSGGMDHVRVHPKFLHSNATSHKWALGAFAELLDNALDEVCNGATYVNIDMLSSRKDCCRMLLIEDNGGGMDPDKMRQCMSLGYSAKSKLANTIGQYGNGFKTSTMRLGADVIVFSRCPGKDGKSSTQSIGLLSYTFLRSTGKEDIVVPMLDYEREGQDWKKIIRSSVADWNKNVETIVQWSPFSSEADLLRQFNLMLNHGTRIIIYNLWEDDQGLLELDFDADPQDIQLRGVNRDEKNIQMAKKFPNSRHFLTYRHSLRSYASILYLRLPCSFRIILRGKDVEHHNIVNDMMLSQEITYRPQPGADGILKDTNMTAVVTIGFVKDAKYHIDVQGFNVYHKNRLIKPFWRLWNAAGSDGRGVIGVLEANFVEPAHDKQGFERTTVLARLETRLIQMQKNYWSSNCQKIGYAPRRNKNLFNESAKNGSNLKLGGKESGEKLGRNVDRGYDNGNVSSNGSGKTKTPPKSGQRTRSPEPSSPPVQNVSDDDMEISHLLRQASARKRTPPIVKSFQKDGMHSTRSSSKAANAGSQHNFMSGGSVARPATRSQSKVSELSHSEPAISESTAKTIDQLKQENHELKKRLKRRDAKTPDELMQGLQCEKCESLEVKLQEAQQKIEELNKEQESLIDIFSEERDRRDREEESLRKKLKDASNTIHELLEKVKLLDRIKATNCRADR